MSIDRNGTVGAVRPGGAREPVVAALRGLTKRYGPRTVLDGIDLEIRAGELVALLGKSGSGKTTILRILSGLEAPSAGGAEILVPHSVVFQEPRLIPNKRVWKNVALGLSGAGRRDIATGLLAEVGLEHHRDSWPGLLSGGEAQRVGVARALATRPRFLLLDEPFAALDALTRLDIQKLSLSLRAEHGFGALLVTHDVDEAVALADRVIVLQDGGIALDEQIDAPHPRKRSTPRFVAVRDRLLAALGVDVSSF
ncbi:ABC transporter ATP-binding protein [Leucobacter weissii]|uniref:ABC transporter ATP-binding protein n=1 Tax=Leucobacter weissii TaxID=1983706 RepID=A0A939MMJ5_9MICO|nr:ABC transporter ATP-binding protein [Leucobacter weissii]MBO1901357.1 ABC transporter ATP-binding protein [Leucobacter weissii]